MIDWRKLTLAALFPALVGLAPAKPARDPRADWLAEHGYEPEYGARPLRRLIQREVDDRIADLFVTGALVDGGSVTVDAAAGELIVRAESPAVIAA